MSKKQFFDILKKEVQRIDAVGTTKRHEKVIDGFTNGRAMIKGKKYLLFNSNDYFGLRFHPKVRKAEEEASKKYGAGPGAVRFISGTMAIHKELEKAIAAFHGREDALIFSSAFAANMAVIHCMIKGQSKDSLVSGDTLVISDELNHRSIIDSIRIAGLEKENKAVFKHMDIDDLRRVLDENKGKFKRAVVVSDGIFSMLGEAQNVKKLQDAADEFGTAYEEGVITIIDDAHGVGCYGKIGRGCEEAGRCDLLIGTMGKAFGADGGYVVGDKIVMDYLRESAATYIYSNPITPGTAGAALASITMERKELLKRLNENIAYFKTQMKLAGFTFAVESSHPIQPLLIGDTLKTKEIVEGLFKRGILVTNISYPVVPKGRDEIRVQLSALHTKKEIDDFVDAIAEVGRQLGLN